MQFLSRLSLFDVVVVVGAVQSKLREREREREERERERERAEFCTTAAVAAASAPPILRRRLSVLRRRGVAHGLNSVGGY